MKKISSILKSFMILIIAVSPIFCFNYETTYASSYAEIVIEKTSGRILHSQNENEKMPMASTTKIITAITVIDHFDLNKIITIPLETTGIEGSSVYLKTGEKFTVLDLLYGLMLRSGNDCAETLALAVTSDRNEFIDLMNKTAKKCGAKNTNLTNPHGLHDDLHYTTCLDLALISAYAMKNATFKKIVSTKKHVATELTSNEKRVWLNKNKMLTNYSGATGIKTGYTKKAGRCLVSSAEQNGMELISVVLNVPPMFERSSQILDEAFANFRLVKLIDSKKFNYRIPCKDRSKYVNLKIDEDFYYPISKSERVSAQIYLPEFIENSVDNNKKVGEIKLFIEKQLIFCQNIYTLFID